MSHTRMMTVPIEQKGWKQLNDRFEQLHFQFGQIERKYGLIMNKEMNKIVKQFTKTMDENE